MRLASTSWRMSRPAEGRPGRRHEVQLHCHADQLRQRSCAGLLHYACAVELDRALAEAQIDGHHLVGAAGHEHLEHFPLARRECMEALYELLTLAQLGAVGGIALERPAYVTQQNLCGDRFLKKSKCALKQGLHSGRDLRVSTDEY